MRIHLFLVVVSIWLQAACNRTGSSDDRPKRTAAVLPTDSNWGIQSDHTGDGTTHQKNRNTTLNQESTNSLPSGATVGNMGTDNQITMTATTQMQPTSGLGNPLRSSTSTSSSNGTSTTITTPDDTSACGTDCSGKGTCQKHGTVAVCACDKGYTPSSSRGDDCVPTTQVCKGGEINHDVDRDGVKEQFFKPSETECRGYELVNYTRATHDDEGTPESHTPLAYNLIWSAHARNHSKHMFEQGTLFHADHQGAWQNCASPMTPDTQFKMYMTGPGEPHCSKSSHHCNIMRSGLRSVGIGNWPIDGVGYNTQNLKDSLE